LVALVVYLLLAAILTFGHALYVAQGLQQAADLAAREIARTPLPADDRFEDALANPLGKRERSTAKTT
jgi:Flp pilus assembly protein TadG